MPKNFLPLKTTNLYIRDNPEVKFIWHNNYYGHGDEPELPIERGSTILEPDS